MIVALDPVPAVSGDEDPHPYWGGSTNLNSYSLNRSRNLQFRINMERHFDDHDVLVSAQLRLQPHGSLIMKDGR